MKKIIVILITACMFTACNKMNVVPMAKIQPKLLNVIDTVSFYVYAADFDSAHALSYNSIKIKWGTDSVILPCQVDMFHTYKNYTLDTITNHIMVAEDSAFLKMALKNAGDTVKYYVFSALGPGAVHAADFYYQTGTFTRVWENPLFSPYGILGIHISPGYVNKVYIP